MTELDYFLFLATFFSVGSLIFFLIKKSKTDEKQTESIRDLERRITDLLMGQLKEVRDSQNGISRTMQEQISSFAKEATQIRAEIKQMQENVKDISSFQEIFKSPKLRGQWGEASLEYILSQHFPPELYERQYLFSSGEQVDAILKLPNGKILPIDSKFPSENFSKMVESNSEDERKQYRKRFIDDVKNRVNEIATKYILPAEKTTDFALMYVPAEAIYYEIVNNIGRDFDLVNHAWSKRIILSSPNTIYLTLRTIEYWFKESQISRQTQEILRRLNRINRDAAKLMDDFRKLGNHLKNAVSSYDASEKRLNLFSERVERLLENKDYNKLE